jgi:tartrate-resistant acid phosphatase type 5
MEQTPHLVTRRHALKTTLLFGSGLLAQGLGCRLSAAEPAPSQFKGGIHVLAFGDFGTANDKQRQVAQQMHTFAGKLGAPLSGVLALGDNFYGHLTPETIKPRFEDIYSKEHLDCPFYATLGNHDYGPSYDSKQGRAKADMQLAYATENPNSRWKMPAKWYSYELGPADHPLVKVISLDGNYFEGGLTPQEKIAQRRWLEAEMEKPLRAKWLWMVSHYPLVSDSKVAREKERANLLGEWDRYLKDKDVSLYLAGHDHNLQHLRVEGLTPDFIVSGGGGAGRYDVNPSDRGFSMQTRGFNHIHVTEDKLTVQFINPDGKLLHAFERDRKGASKLIAV